MGERIRGRAGQAALKRRRALHPWCASCKERGITRPAAQIDHVQPLALGGQDVDDNTQGLCLSCHAVKSALEDASAGGAANHPDWLRPAAGHLTIVTGPPCAGKSTLVEAEASPRDLVIDLDLIAEQIAPGFLSHRRWTSDLLNKAVRARNAMLGSLSRQGAGDRAWFIVSAPTAEERAWWARALQPATVLHLDPGQAVCLHRSLGRRGAIHTDSVNAWYWRSRQRWKPEAPKRKRVAFGADGYPVEEVQ